MEIEWFGGKEYIYILESYTSLCECEVVEYWIRWTSMNETVREDIIYLTWSKLYLPDKFQYGWGSYSQWKGRESIKKEYRKGNSRSNFTKRSITKGA